MRKYHARFGGGPSEKGRQRNLAGGLPDFYTGERKAGTVRHVRTGQTVDVPARRVAAFRVGDVLKRAVAGTGKRRRRWGVLGR